MKRKGLYFLIALALGGVTAVHAQDTAAASDSAASTTTPSYDGRWYIAPTIGGYYNDTDRNTHSRQFYYGLGVGRFFAPNFSLDFFIDRTQRDIDHSGGKWANNNYGVAARYYFGQWTAWRPYLLGAVMGSYHHDPMSRAWAPAAELGVGLSKTITENSDFRVEAGYRYDWDDKSQPSQNGYGDWLLGFSIVSRFGQPPAPPAPVAPPPPPPSTPACAKEFRNGVDLCDNKCPNLPEGTVVGPDGCPQKVVIDLRGVNFKWDYPKKGHVNAADIGKALAAPVSASLDTLNQAVDTLQRYPNVQVMVAGYTDSTGSAAYNQGLSMRRAQIVYDYLVAHGIDPSRLEGPVGHGENDPIGDNSTVAGRAENRRTELQVQQ